MTYSSSSHKDSFLYECEEVPFDEIPPEPGREIKDSGYGELVIHVSKDSKNIDDLDVDNSNYGTNYDTSLKRTVHQNSATGLRRSLSFRDDNSDNEFDSSRKRKNLTRSAHSPDIRSSKMKWGMNEKVENKSSYSSYQSDYYNKHNADSHVQMSKTLEKSKDNYVNGVKYTAQQIRDQQHCEGTKKLTAQQLRDKKSIYQNTVASASSLSHRTQQSRDPQYSDIGSSSKDMSSRMRRNTSLERERATSSLNFVPKNRDASSRPGKCLSDRLGPPVHNKRVLMGSKNFIERNKTAVLDSRSKGTAVGSRKALPSSISSDKTTSKSTIKKVATHNPISKAKKKMVPQKSNLSKNIALSKKIIAVSEPSSSSSNSNTDAISNFIQEILSEPDVKQIISSIAQQTVSQSPDQENNQSTSSKISSFEDGTRILDKANELIMTNFRDKDADEFKTDRKIPPVKTKHVKLSSYCKDCKLEFPTTMLRDLHCKTEMHCFVNGDWWKFNPRPPVIIPKNRYPLSIFCILCWDIVRLQSSAVFEEHMRGKRHKINCKKFSEIFDHPPRHEWCMWEELSMNFRNSFVPVPSQLRNSMHPEYFYDQRIIRK